MRECRVTLGVSQAQMAESLGLSKNYYSAVERGEKRPGTTVVLLYARVHGVVLEWLLTGKGPQWEQRAQASGDGREAQTRGNAGGDEPDWLVSFQRIVRDESEHIEHARTQLRVPLRELLAGIGRRIEQEENL